MAYGKCILCSNDSEGQLVSDSHVIRFIRIVKQKLNMAQNNTLVVCGDCMATYGAKRKKFERKWALNAVLAVGVVLLLVALPLMTGMPFSLSSLVLAPLLAFFIALLALTDYVPPLAGQVAQPQPPAPAMMASSGTSAPVQASPQPYIEVEEPYSPQPAAPVSHAPSHTRSGKASAHKKKPASKKPARKKGRGR